MDEIVRINYIYKFDLQFFAAEDEGRTELPTEFKKRKAREEEGLILKSQDIVSFFVTFGTLISLIYLIKWSGKYILDIFYYYLQENVEITIGNFGALFKFGLIRSLYFFGPFALISIILAILSNYFQVGFFFFPKAIVPDLKKILPNFSRYFKQIFGLRGFVNFLKSFVVVFGSFAIFLSIMNSSIFKILQSSQNSIQTTLELFYIILRDTVLRIAVIILILAILDYFFQRREYIEALKMSRYELKQEIYEQEGRPEIKQARNKRRREIMKRKSLEEVKTADVVITNPTHIAVALKYEYGIDIAPKVVAKGEDLWAKRIKEIAIEYDIYIYENKPLARELYKRLDIGDYIPYDLYEIMVKVFEVVYKEKKSKNFSKIFE
ncbi:MAG: EscU/YscU/HrcU family type III secretion system export apparatus switch protein [Spirochaetes bacterium]|nr:EscU/YscU/HrcU family type III secretion system export apparatus switch protein [Spirochaetota bacterium]